MNVNIRIDRLVLDGIDMPHAQRPELQASVEQELARMIDTSNLPQRLQSSGATYRLTTSDIQLGDAPGNLGQQIAGSVMGGLGQ